jgi:hypothetical protein
MRLASEFATRGIMRGGILMLAADDATALVERARDAGVKVIGVDGFWISETSTHPDQDHTLFSGRVNLDPWDEAAGFIRERADLGLMFEIVLDE